MSTHATWWANRKSRIGLSPAARPAPHTPDGRPWWTAPPVAPPQPEHIEFAVRFMMELRLRQPSAETNLLMQNVGNWLKRARQLLHEHVEADRGELATTDGLMVAAARVMNQMAGHIGTAGGQILPEWERVMDVVRKRAARAKRERAETRITREDER